MVEKSFGMGFLYVNKNILDIMEPDFYGYFNLKDPEGGWGEYLQSPKRSPFDKFQIKNTAQKFETGGSGNYIGALGLYENIKTINDYGIKNIETKIMELNSELEKGLSLIDSVRFASDLQPGSRSGITTFNLIKGILLEKELAEYLEKRGIFISLRYTSGVGGIRVSPHYYNTKDDIFNFLNAVEIFLKN
jgi:cysteine desulfurase/selenocysteine lyase